MVSTQTMLCDVLQISKGKYAVTWNKNVSGLSTYHGKVGLLLDTIKNDSNSLEVGIILSRGYVVWIGRFVLYNMTKDEFFEYLVKVSGIRDPREIEGAIFDNINDVGKFVNQLEQKYIWHTLKE